MNSTDCFWMRPTQSLQAVGDGSSRGHKELRLQSERLEQWRSDRVGKLCATRVWRELASARTLSAMNSSLSSQLSTSPRDVNATSSDCCFPLHYELLVQSPEFWMRRLLRFLELPFDRRVLRHHELVGRPGGVRLSECVREDCCFTYLFCSAIEQCNRTSAASIT